ncbi:MAG: Response regulator MprA [Chlamydiae bacterium]|nr:Response regulator MprA [Chlamydiota bacterium]
MQKILLADSDKELLEKVRSAPGNEHYIFEEAHSGNEVLEKMGEFEPTLVYLDLLLPEMHGIELLKKIRSNPKWEGLGVILSSTNSMIQNFHAAVREGVDFFLPKPFEIPFLYILFNRFFEGTLLPEPFGPEKPPETDKGGAYTPKKHRTDSYLKFWGTRGSNPVSGPSYTRFGGSTVCLEIRHGEEMVIIDAGTGIRPLGEEIDTSQFKTIHIFLSHTHWDHVTGFPFFNPIYDPDVQVVIWSPVGFEKSTRELFTEMLAYAYFPVRLEDMRAKLSFNDLRDGHPVSIGDITIDSHYAFHPGATLCFKIHVAGKTYGYATDNEMFLGYHGNPNALSKDNPLIVSHQSIIDFFSTCDTLIHEAQFTPLEYQKRVGWGHSSISNATLLCKYAETKEWIITHHDPKHTDEELLDKLQLTQDILTDCNIDCRVEMAFDEMKIIL